MNRHRPTTLLAGISAQAAGVLWILQWSHALVAHGPTSRDRMEMFVGMTWMDSAALLAIPYLLLVPPVLVLVGLARRRSARRSTAVFGWIAVAALVVCAAATLLEFRVWEWATYAGTFDGTTSPVWVAGPIRAVTSAGILTIALVGLAVAGRLPVWLTGVLAVGTLATFFVGGPLPPVPGLAWLALGGWLLSRSPTGTPYASETAR